MHSAPSLFQRPPFLVFNRSTTFRLSLMPAQAPELKSPSASDGEHGASNPVGLLMATISGGPRASDLSSSSAQSSVPVLPAFISKFSETTSAWSMDGQMVEAGTEQSMMSSNNYIYFYRTLDVRSSHNTHLVPQIRQPPFPGCICPLTSSFAQNPHPLLPPPLR